MAGVVTCMGAGLHAVGIVLPLQVERILFVHKSGGRAAGLGWAESGTGMPPCFSCAHTASKCGFPILTKKLQHSCVAAVHPFSYTYSKDDDDTMLMSVWSMINVA